MDYLLLETPKGGIKRKMKRLWKSRKALSPVVAAIILIAVTVAVSIAVAAWMGALTFTWMGYESLEITEVTWTGPNAGVTIRVHNDGTKDVTIHHVEMNYATTGVTVTSPSLPYGPLTTEANNYVDMVMTFAYQNGTSYDISVVTSGGYEFTDHFTGGQDVG